MVRSVILFAVVFGMWFFGSVALAQPATPKAPKLIPAAEWLKQPLTFSFDKVPLKEAIKKLNVQCFLDVKAMEDEALNVDTPISGKSEAGPALESLNAVLQTVKLSAELRHDVIYIAPAEPSQSAKLVCRFYRLKPMVAEDGMIKEITTQTAINSWDTSGGRGHIASLGNGVMAISQSPHIHRDIEKKFDKQLLRVIAPADRITAMVPTKGMNPLAKMRERLRRPISVDFRKTPLNELVPALGKLGKVTMVLDEKALKSASINVRTPVTVRLEGVPLESVLALTLQYLGTSWTIDGDQVLFTTRPDTGRRLIEVTYDVRDLTTGRDLDSLIDALTRTVQPDSWTDVGGLGKIAVAEGGLTITQSVHTHYAIETWLADLRTALKPVAAEK